MFAVSKEVEAEFWDRFKVEEMVWEEYNSHPHIIARGLKAQFYLSEPFLRSKSAYGVEDIVFDLGCVFYDASPTSSVNVLRSILHQLPKDSWIFLSLNQDFSKDDALVREGNYRKMRAPIFVDMRLLSEAHGY